MRASRLCLALAFALVALGVPAPEKPAMVVARDVLYGPGGRLDIYTREGSHRAPVVVMMHGCCGDKRDLTQLARGLSAAGAVTFNVSWTSMPEGGRFPGVYAEAACAVRFARANAGTYGGDPGRVTVLGWSDGALLAAVAAMAGARFQEGCPVEDTSSAPAKLVGVGAFLGWPVPTGPIDARYVNERSIAFFGGAPEDAPDAWRSGNPYTYLGRQPELAIGLVVGAGDVLVDDNLAFAAAARNAGHGVTVSVVDGGGHLDLLAPSMPQGAATVRAVMRTVDPRWSPGRDTGGSRG